MRMPLISFPRSISARLAALVLVVALPLIALIAFDYSQRLVSRVELAKGSAREVAGTVAASLGQLVNNERALLAALAARPAQRVERPAVCDPLIAELLALEPYRANLAVVTAAGEPVCSAVPLPAGKAISLIGNEHVQRLLRTGEFSIGEPFQGPITGRWVVPLAFPRHDAAGRLIGWVGTPLDVERIGELLTKVPMAAGDVVTLVSPQGRLIARSTDTAKWVGTDIRNRPHAADLLGGALDGWRGVGLDGTARIWGVANVPLAGWKVIVGLDEAKLLAPPNAALLRNGIAIVVILLLVAAVAFRTGRAIAAPIQALARTVGRIAGGEHSLRAPLTGASEIDSVAGELNRMLDALDRFAAENAQAIAALRESNEKLQLFVDFAPSAIAMFDREMRYIAFSRRWIEDYRLQDRDILGRSHYEVFPDLPERWKAVHRRCLAGAVEQADEEAFPREDGSVDWVRWGVRPWRQASGDIGGIIVFSEVITARKRAEEKLRESQQRLAALTRRLLEVQERERRSVARELHDEVGGVLTAVKLNLLSLRGRNMCHAGEAGEAALADSLALVDGAIQSVRSLSLDLRPAVLDDLGLIPALKWYCERQAQRSGVAIALVLDAIDLKSAPQLESACFRIVQEALTNALRHAGAQHIEVTLQRSDSHFTIEIGDDGGGCQVALARQRGLAGESGGLLGMEERAALLGGRLFIDSAPGAGTRVRVEFALPDGGFD